MSIFIKAGLWASKKLGYKGELNLDALIESKIPVIPIATYDVYTAILNQTGTNNPTAKVLENTLGQTVVWSYNDTGNFITNNIIGGTENNLWVSITKKFDGVNIGAEEHNTGGPSSIYLYQASTSGVPTNGLEKGYIEIRRYHI